MIYDFEILFLRKNKKGIIEAECFTMTFDENPGQLEFHNDMITQKLCDYETAHIRKVNNYFKKAEGIISWI